MHRLYTSNLVCSTLDVNNNDNNNNNNNNNHYYYDVDRKTINNQYLSLNTFFSSFTYLFHFN
ncbi:hypothetical protein DERP_005013 [Dermatophagoides pteronyssinus]|uniref:Uncharacterized protein n=1 Tax=Dermatophagoides pteronyssinus TaxID=6956 RepID=A0ABQ8JT40_DERPT|nr:hypothetical protein DERP_005013 [Dermatophagoides pteronyssinus]